MLFAIWVTAVATGVIAWYAWANHRIVSKIQSRDDEFRQEVKDLYQAIAVANLISAHGSVGAYSTMEGRIEKFNEYYKGKTPIFELRG